MKRLVLITIGLWLITIFFVIGVINNSEMEEDLYKININRIHQRLNSDWKANHNLIASLSQEEMGMISSIELLDYKDSDQIKRDNFFSIKDLDKNPALYLPIEGSSYLAKYIINLESNNKNQLVVVCVIISMLYIFVIGILIYINKRILQPMKRMSLIPKQLAAGYLDRLKVSAESNYFNEFLWGLDMLREKLEEQKNSNFELEKQRKTLVASLSHDIKTPLSSIKNYAIALKEGIYEERSEQDRALEVIINKSEVIGKLTKELLKSSNQAFNADTLEVNLNDRYMSEITQRLNQIIQQKTELLHMEYQTAELREDLLVSADLDALSQVFDNIVENAVKYGDLNRIKVRLFREDYYQCIAIENSGIPIAESEIKHIFSSYYRGSNVKEKPGYGLGLYICKKLMRGMEGDVYARNTAAGVEFVVVIKLAS